jgi:Flp pilus assembly protein CpaB
MKGAMGLTVAAGLGIVGAVCNWLYLQRLAREQATVSFIAVRDGVQLNIGDMFNESDLELVPIPAGRVGTLRGHALEETAWPAVVGAPANRPFEGGELLLEEDLISPAAKDVAETLRTGEAALSVPVDTRTVVLDQINPGDTVTFVVGGAGGPTPIGAGPGSAEYIGPFTVLALGTRRERPNVDQASRSRAGGGTNTITVVVKFVGGQLEPNAEKLNAAIRTSGNQGVGVLLHSSRRES